MADDRTVRFGPFKSGVNNVDPATALTAEELLHAVNIDIDRNGRVTRRKGFTQIVSEPNTHSLWARDNDTAFYASGVDLKMLKLDSAGNVTPSLVRAGALQLFKHVAFLELHGTTYYSNGIIRGSVRADDTAHDWGCERPSTNPILAAGAGALPAGRYLVGITFLNDLGEESGMPAPQSIDLLTQGGITLTSIPPAISADVTLVRVSVSQTNGELMYRYLDLAIGTTTMSITGLAQMGSAAGTMFQDQMIPSDLLAYYNGRIYGAVGKIVWYTEAMNYGLSDPRRNFLMFPADVGVIKPVTDGIFFGTRERVYFYRGGKPADFQAQIVQMHGAVPGTGLDIPTAPGEPRRVGWFSERGFTIGLDGGAVQVGDKERIMLGQYAQGGSFYREANGVRQVIGTMRSKTRVGLVSRDHAEAEVRRATLDI